MKIKFWGVRGDTPCPGAGTVKYGGNTMCIEICFSNPDRLIIIDAGSGIRELGNDMLTRDFSDGKITADILLTHTHWDHIMGFPYFAPVYVPGTKLRVFGPVNYKKDTLKSMVGGLFEYDYFQISQKELSADINYIDINEGAVDLEYDGIKLAAKILNHPILCLGYRFEYKGKVVCTAYDTEPFQNLLYLSPDDPSCDESMVKEGEEIAAELNQEIMDFFNGADLLIYDAQYTAKEYYESKIGWGHTPIEYAIKSAQKAGVKRLALVHHDPLSTDAKLDELYEKYCNAVDLNGMQVFFVREGMEVNI